MALCAAVSREGGGRKRWGWRRDQQLRWIFNQSTLRFLTATAGSVRKLWRTLISMPASFTLCSRSSRVCAMKGRDRGRQTGGGGGGGGEGKVEEEKEVRDSARLTGTERGWDYKERQKKSNRGCGEKKYIRKKTEVQMRNVKKRDRRREDARQRQHLWERMDFFFIRTKAAEKQRKEECKNGEEGMWERDH